MGNLLPPILAPHLAFGVPAVVTPLGGSPVDTTAVRLRGAMPPAVGSVLMSADAAVGLRNTVSIPRDAVVPSLPIGSTIVADFGEGSATWRVDRIDSDFPDEWRVVVS